MCLAESLWWFPIYLFWGMCLHVLFHIILLVFSTYSQFSHLSSIFPQNSQDWLFPLCFLLVWVFKPYEFKITFYTLKDINFPVCLAESLWWFPINFFWSMCLHVLFYINWLVKLFPTKLAVAFVTMIGSNVNI